MAGEAVGADGGLSVRLPGIKGRTGLCLVGKRVFSREAQLVRSRSC